MQTTKTIFIPYSTTYNDLINRYGVNDLVTKRNFKKITGFPVNTCVTVDNLPIVVRTILSKNYVRFAYWVVNYKWHCPRTGVKVLFDYSEEA